MKTRQITLPTIGLIAGTRAALGVGLGFLLADKLSPEMRRAAGWALVAIGAVTTVPLIAQVLGSKAASPPSGLGIRQETIPPYAPLVVAEAAGR